MATEQVDALVIGTGPAGLMAAERMPFPARKSIMAGKSGLNLTRREDTVAFRAAYSCPRLKPILAAFGPEEAVAWAEGLGQPLFTGSTGRVFPRACWE